MSQKPYDKKYSVTGETYSFTGPEIVKIIENALFETIPDIQGGAEFQQEVLASVSQKVREKPLHQMTIGELGQKAAKMGINLEAIRKQRNVIRLRKVDIVKILEEPPPEVILTKKKIKRPKVFWDEDRKLYVDKDLIYVFNDKSVVIAKFGKEGNVSTLTDKNIRELNKLGYQHRKLSKDEVKNLLKDLRQKRKRESESELVEIVTPQKYKKTKIKPPVEPVSPEKPPLIEPDVPLIEPGLQSGESSDGEHTQPSQLSESPKTEDLYISGQETDDSGDEGKEIPYDESPKSDDIVSDVEEDIQITVESPDVTEEDYRKFMEVLINKGFKSNMIPDLAKEVSLNETTTAKIVVNLTSLKTKFPRVEEEIRAKKKAEAPAIRKKLRR